MNIRKMVEKDKQQIIEMMQIFYASPAVLSNGSKKIFEADVEACISDNPYLYGYVMEEDDIVIGYAMLARSFSTEFGKPCVWIEDLYLKPDYRGKGYGGDMLQYIESSNKDALLRLEAEEENIHALKAYRKAGYEVLPYIELIKNKD